MQSAEQIAAIISKKPNALLCVPAGETSVETFSQLIKLNKTGKISFKRSIIVGLDEWVKLGEMKNENCFSFLKKHLFDHIDYSDENLCFFNGEFTQIEKECIKTDNFITKNGPIDMILLGVGMNGHLGLNETGTFPEFYSHIINFDDITKTVGQKYFSKKVKLTSDISLGLMYIMEAKTVILQMNGTKKADVVNRLIDSEICPAFSASIVKSHLNALLLLDK